MINERGKKYIGKNSILEITSFLNPTVIHKYEAELDYKKKT